MVKTILQNEIKKGLEVFGLSDCSDINLEIPADINNGDYATNISFKIAGKLKKNPREIAEKLSAEISSELFKADPKNGFINFFFTDKFIEKMVLETISFKQLSKNKKAVIDYSAPNIAKPFGIGHLRSTIVGQAIYNILKFSGWEVVGVNHLGDWGTQYGKLIYQIKKENKNPEDLTIKELERLYVDYHKIADIDPEVAKEGKNWFKRLEDGDFEALKIWEICIKKSLKEFNKTYSLLDVDIDEVIGESFYQDKMSDVVKEVVEKGIAKISDGALIVEFDDDMPPAMLLKSNKGTTYFTRDLATVKYRIEKWNPDLLIYEIGADQKLHMQQLFRVSEILKWKKASEFVHIAHGMYRLKEGRMSTRKGKTIHLEDVLDKAIERARKIIDQSETARKMSEDEKRKTSEIIGIGAVKYADLKKHYKKDIVFDWEEVMNLKGDSGPYLQYSTIRAKSVLNKNKKNFNFKFVNLSEKEKIVSKKIITFNEMIESAERNLTPSIVANFSYELAKDFNSFYASLPILDAETEEIKIQRLSITKATVEVLEKCLQLLGIAVPEKM